MNLKEDVMKQIEAGFMKSEIRNNLLLNGHDAVEVDKILSNMPEVPKTSSGGSFDWKMGLSILLAIIAVIRIIMRLSK